MHSGGITSEERRNTKLLIDTLVYTGSSIGYSKQRSEFCAFYLSHKNVHKRKFSTMYTSVS